MFDYKFEMNSFAPPVFSALS